MDPEPFLQIFEAENSTVLYITALATIACILCLLFLSAYFSAAEIAFFSLNYSEKEQLKASAKSKKAMSGMLAEPKKLLLSITITNNLIKLAIIFISTVLLNSKLFMPAKSGAEFAVHLAIIAFLLIVFAEFTPKMFAAKFSYKIAKKTFFPIYIAYKGFAPLSAVLLKTISFFESAKPKKPDNLSIDELSHALQFTSDKYIDNRQLLKGITTFGTIEAKEIMKSRVDITAIEKELSFTDLIPVLVNGGYSRVPVYSKSIDNIVGILYLKDLIPFLNQTDLDWQKLVRTPYFVPATKKINDLLREFQSKKMHMAIVVDEYGGTYGIVTLKDILDEVLGEIQDELDDQNAEYTMVSKDSFIFEGKTLLNDFYKIANLPDEPLEEIRGEAETLAGLILEIKGDLPVQGEKLTYKNISFKVTTVDSRRIKRIHVTINRNSE